MKNNFPVVAIIGRPNTGKSSLFNYIVGFRKSIVDSIAGTTRDIVSGESRHSQYASFMAWDTAGYLETEDVLDALAQEKISYALSHADLVLFVVDAQEPHPLDKEIAVLIKKSNVQTIVVANKADNRDYAGSAAEFFSLGFELLVATSVIQKTGMSMLMEQIESLIQDSDRQSIPSDVKISIVGRPNSGKSTLLNTLLGYERMIVSEQAGTTRDATDETFLYRDKVVLISDTAGIKRHAKIKNDVEYYAMVRSAQAIEHSDLVLLLIDASASFDEIVRHDKVLASMIQEKKRSMVFVLNKWDLLFDHGDTNDGKKNQELMKQMERKIRAALPEFHYVPLVFISGKDNYKIDKMMDVVFKVKHDFDLRVVTGTFNNWLSHNILEYDKTKHSSRLKIYYGSQVYTSPPRFIFFINKKSFLHKDFPRFLENRIRTAFEFSGVPITLTFREREFKKTLVQKEKSSNKKRFVKHAEKGR